MPRLPFRAADGPERGEGGRSEGEGEEERKESTSESEEVAEKLPRLSLLTADGPDRYLLRWFFCSAVGEDARRSSRASELNFSDAREERRLGEEEEEE